MLAEHRPSGLNLRKTSLENVQRGSGLPSEAVTDGDWRARPDDPTEGLPEILTLHSSNMTLRAGPGRAGQARMLSVPWREASAGISPNSSVALTATAPKFVPTGCWLAATGPIWAGLSRIWMNRPEL